MDIKMILPCSCQHRGQDKVNGLKQRVHNEAKSGDPSRVIMRCTVCGNEKTVSREQAKQEK